MDRISVLTASRPESKTLAHFVLSYLVKTHDHANTELLINASSINEWNQDLITFTKLLSPKYNIRFFEDEESAGQIGHHKYINALVPHATGDWLFEVCDDMEFTTPAWDTYIRHIAERRGADSNKIYQIIPGLEKKGASVCVLSRGWVETTGQFAGYQNTDTWLNTIMDTLGDAIKGARRIEDATMTILKDYSNEPEFAELVRHGVLPRKPKENDKSPLQWGEQEVRELLEKEVEKIRLAIENGK